jgi:hypothetical protein
LNDTGKHDLPLELPLATAILALVIRRAQYQAGLAAVRCGYFMP